MKPNAITPAIALTLALLGTAASATQAAEPIPQGARLAATCTSCHGTNGQIQGNALPSLAGQQKEALLESLKAFKAGTRPATIMTQIAKGYNDEQLEALAAYFAAQKQGGAQ